MPHKKQGRCPRAPSDKPHDDQARSSTSERPSSPLSTSSVGDRDEACCKVDEGVTSPDSATILTRAVLVEQLKQQLRRLSSAGSSEDAAGQETRDLLRLLDTGASSDWTAVFHGDAEEDQFEDSEVQQMLDADLDALALQLRCNLVTEDRSHVGRIYLNCFVGEDAISLLESHASSKSLNILGRPGCSEVDGAQPQMQQQRTGSVHCHGDAASVASEVSNVSNSTITPPPSPPGSPRSYRTNSSAGTGASRRRGTAAGQHPLTRSEALFVANELLKRGEWQQLTGLDKATQEREQNTQRSIYRGPTGRKFVMHPALECFTLFRMRTSAALNEEHRWPHRVARNPVALTCHLLQLLSNLPFCDEATPAASVEDFCGHGRGDLHSAGDRESVSSLDPDADLVDTCSLRDERGSTAHSAHGSMRGAALRGSVRKAASSDMYDRVLSSKAFRRVQEAAAELQAVDLSTLNQRGLLCFWINIHNALAVHGHCAFRTVGVSDVERRTFMKAARYRIGTTYLSLFDVNLILRTRFLKSSKMEPRVHFALSFGSVSSPQIRSYYPDGLGHLLDRAARDYCQNIVAIPADRRVTLPVGFKYFAADFAKTRRGLVEYVARYSSDLQQRYLLQILESDGKTIDIRYMAPDWHLDLASCLALLREPMDTHLLVNAHVSAIPP